MVVSQDKLFIDTLRDQIVNVLVDDDTEIYMEEPSDCGCYPSTYYSLNEVDAGEVADKVIEKFLNKMKIS